MSKPERPGLTATAGKGAPFFPEDGDVAATAGMSLREEKKELTRRSLAREAMQRFLDNGYEETTLDEIASAVRVSLTTLLRYYDSKERLFFAWQHHSLREFEQTLATRNREVSVLVTYRGWIVREAARATRSHEQLRFAQVRDQVPALRAHWLGIVRAYQDLLAAAFEEELGEGSKLQACLVAAALNGAIDAVSEDWLVSGMGFDMAEADLAVIDLAAQLFAPIGVSMNGSWLRRTQ